MGVTFLVQRNELRTYAETKRDWREWPNIKQSAKSKIEMAVPIFMLDNMKFLGRGLCHIWFRNIVQHLIDIYVKIYQSDLKQNKSKIYEAWYPSLSFDNLIYRSNTIP